MSTPRPSDSPISDIPVPADPDVGAPTNAVIQIDRIHHYRDTIRSYIVSIDGDRAGTVRDDNSNSFPVAPGQHTVRLRLLWITSPAVTIDVAPGMTARLTCGPNGGILQAWRLFLAPTTAIFLRAAD